MLGDKKTMPRLWKEGDKVTVKRTCSHAYPGREYTLRYGGGEHISTLFASVVGPTHVKTLCWCQDNWILLGPDAINTWLVPDITEDKLFTNPIKRR